MKVILLYHKKVWDIFFWIWVEIPNTFWDLSTFICYAIHSLSCWYLLKFLVEAFKFFFDIFTKKSLISENTVNPRLEVDLWYKSTSIRGRAIGGSVQALIIGKSLNPSKLPYLDHYGLVEIKKFAPEIIIFEIPLIQV